MERLVFKRQKYGKELLIDACNEEELEIIADTLVLNFYTLVFFEQGSGTYHLDTETIPIQGRTVLFVKPGQINKVDKVTFNRCHLLFFEGDFLDEFFNDSNFIFKFGYFHNPALPSYLQLDNSTFAKYYGFAKEIRQEIHRLNADSVHIIRSLIYYLLARLSQEYANSYGTSQQTIQNPKVLAFLRLLEQNVKNQKSVSSYAKDLQISRVQLNHLCKKHFSKTAQQLVRERTIAEIKKEIKYSQKDFSEIAYDFNFSAPSHFSRFVKQMTGYSPQAFKEHLSNW